MTLSCVGELYKTCGYSDRIARKSSKECESKLTASEIYEHPRKPTSSGQGPGNIMPHATTTTIPFTGFQAIILCGPGVSLNTFTANPEEFPKALVPVANRPMVWYPMDWCYRMGITSEFLTFALLPVYHCLVSCHIFPPPPHTRARNKFSSAHLLRTFHDSHRVA